MGLMPRKLNESQLDQADYVRSLLIEVVRAGIISEDMAQEIRMRFVVLLQRKVKRFTFNESSSVRVETAEHIFESILYTVGVELKSYFDPEEQINLLLTSSPEDIYRNGLEKIKAMVETSKQYYMDIVGTALPLGILAYHETVEEGIPAFFKQYDKDFAAQETVIFHDYPLAFDKMDLVGVEYILLYLKKLRFENRFCRCFSNDTITVLLKSYDKRYADLLFNAFLVILKNYIGCILANRDKNALVLTAKDCLQIERQLFAFIDKDYQRLAVQVNAVIMNDIKLKTTFERQYLFSVIKETMISFQNAVQEKKTASFFVLPSKEILGGEIQFTDGESLSDSDFRKISKEIYSCRYLSDKMVIMKQKIHSITDIADLLNADCFYGTEYADYFRTLSSMEFALLLAHTILFHFPVEDSLMEQLLAMPLAAEWQIQLCHYLGSISTEQIQEITDYVKSIDIE